MSEQKLLRYQHIRRLTERTDEKGYPVPFSMKYLCLNGEVMEARNVVTTSVDTWNKKRTILFLDSGQYRTIHDVLILEVNNHKIVVS